MDMEDTVDMAVMADMVMEDTVMGAMVVKAVMDAESSMAAEVDMEGELEDYN